MTEVERVMGLADKYEEADPDLSSTRAALRAEVERLVRERDMWRDERLQQIKRVGQECDDWRTRAEAAEQDAKRWRELLASLDFQLARGQIAQAREDIRAAIAGRKDG